MNEFVKNLNRIEFVVTMACTGSCIHCSEGEHIGCTGHIDTDLAVKAVRDVCSHYKIENLMTFGGEPLLYPETVCAVHSAAKELGIARRDLITNGYFSNDCDRIKEVAAQLNASGINRILLSVDAFHQATIPIEPVKYFAECIKELGINIFLSPAWLVSREADNPYNVKTREIIKEFDYLNIPVGEGNVIFPQGNAVKYLGEYFDTSTEYTNPYEEDPKDIRTLSFSESGDVLNGNIYHSDIIDIIKNYKP